MWRSPPDPLHFEPMTADRSSALSITRRSWLGAAAALALPSAHAQTTDLSALTLHAAKYKGGDDLLLDAAKLRATPYKLEYGEFGSGNLIVEAINAGSIDIGSMSEIPPIFAAISGAKIRIVAVLLGDTNNQVVLVPKGSAVQRIADLKGKRVGYVRATTTHYYLTRMLEDAGLSFADITPVALNPADGRAAFDRGNIDAWAIYGYSVPLTIAATGARVLVTAKGYLSGNYVYAARKEALDDPKLSAAIGEYLARVNRAYDWQQRSLDAWAEIQGKALDVPPAIVRDLLKNATQRSRLVPIRDEHVASAKQVADLFARVGVTPRKVDMAPLFDRRYGELLARSAA